MNNPMNSITFAKLAQEYCEHLEYTKNNYSSPIAIGRKIYLVHRYILPYWGNTSVSEISASDILRWQGHLNELTNPQNGGQYSHSYLTRIHQLFAAIMRFSVNIGVQDRLPLFPNVIKGKPRQSKHLYNIRTRP